VRRCIPRVSERQVDEVSRTGVRADRTPRRISGVSLQSASVHAASFPRYIRSAWPRRIRTPTNAEYLSDTA